MMAVEFLDYYGLVCASMAVIYCAYILTLEGVESVYTMMIFTLLIVYYFGWRFTFFEPSFGKNKNYLEGKASRCKKH